MRQPLLKHTHVVKFGGYQRVLFCSCDNLCLLMGSCFHRLCFLFERYLVINNRCLDLPALQIHTPRMFFEPGITLSLPSMGSPPLK